MIREYVGTVKGKILAVYPSNIYKIYSNGFYCVVLPLQNCERNKQVYFSSDEGEIEKFIKEEVSCINV
jgi:hypothetical protein